MTTSPLSPSPQAGYRAGTVALIGRPNVGKSTLTNSLLQTKVSIVSPKPQTTRYKIRGVLQGEGYQLVLLDAPGWPPRPKDELAHRMVRGAQEAIQEADLVVLLGEPRLPGDVERRIAAELTRLKSRALAVITKIDTVKPSSLLPILAAYSELYPFLEIVPISALRNDGLDLLLELLLAHLPEGDPLFPSDQLTDRTERFLAAEIIREKVFLLYGQEVPYATAVEVEAFKEEPLVDGRRKVSISAAIYVDRPSQKAILVGRAGRALKEVGTAARPEIEGLLGGPVYLELWVKVQPHWRRNPSFLKSLEEQ